ncbi:MAG TPA: hypothetical protein VMG41_04615 [Gemmatimonadales bacterium]|nr:hypothetical protein [Gemmatimonadales bacterium]
MSQIKVRNADRNEYNFSTVEEFAAIIQSGGITADWEIYHVTGARWLPITHHPLFTGRMVQLGTARESN